jgi:tagatose-6-phosphate ketose/aldose isomerase
MLLAGILIASVNSKIDFNAELKLLQNYAGRIFNSYLDRIKEVASLSFERAIFLGSGLFSGIAEESHLKLQELSDGRIICKHDSFLGFRHGPKAVIDEKSLLVFHFSNNMYSQQYERDLVQSINGGAKGLYRIGIMESDINIDLDLKIILGGNGRKINEKMLSIISVLPAQILGFFKSLNLGLEPDNPSISGTITRVVQGVKLYPYVLRKLNYV